MTDTVDSNKALVRKFVEQGKNGRNLDLVDELFAPGYKEHNDTVAKFGYKNFLAHFIGAFPDTRVTIEQIVAEGDLVAYRGVESGTHRGEFLGIPPTNKSASYTEIHFFRVKDARIVEHWVTPDIFDWFQQLGILPKMGG